MQTQSTRRRHSFNRRLEKLSPPDHFGTMLAAVGIVRSVQPSAEGVSNRTCPAGSLLPPRSWSSQPCSTNSGKNKVAGNLQKYIYIYVCNVSIIVQNQFRFSSAKTILFSIPSSYNSGRGCCESFYHTPKVVSSHNFSI